eukprot:XP_016659825.1 PREDICTED: uncharacterized protein LOC107883732 isoform X1 [Acyrthosiphon pisum]
MWDERRRGICIPPSETFKNAVFDMKIEKDGPFADSDENKRIFRITQLKYRLHIDDKRKQRFTNLEAENSQGRALSGEDVYEVYVMRLINTGCRPLGEPEWKIELKNTGSTNTVAVRQGSKKLK